MKIPSGAPGGSLPFAGFGLATNTSPLNPGWGMTPTGTNPPKDNVPEGDGVTLSTAVPEAPVAALAPAPVAERAISEAPPAAMAPTRTPLEQAVAGSGVSVGHGGTLMMESPVHQPAAGEAPPNAFWNLPPGMTAHMSNFENDQAQAKAIYAQIQAENEISQMKQKLMAFEMQQKMEKWKIPMPQPDMSQFARTRDLKTSENLRKYLES